MKLQARAFVASAFILAAVLHIGFVFATQDYKAPQTYEAGVIAGNILAGKGFVFKNWLAAEEGPTAFQAPFYPYFLALCLKVFGTYAFLVVQLIQALALASLVFPAYGLARILVGTRTGVVAAALASIYPPYIYYSKVMAYDIFLIVFSAYALFLLLSLVLNPSLRKAAGAGVLMGLANLASPVLLPFAALSPLWVWWRLGTRPKAWFYAGAVLLSTAMVILPWTIRNYRVFDAFVPVKSQFGLMIFLGNRPGFPGVLDPHRKYESIEGFGRDSIPAQEFEKIQAMSEVQRDRYVGAIGRRYISQDPLAFLKRSIYRVYAFWWIHDRFPHVDPNVPDKWPEARKVLVRKWTLGVLYAFALLGAMRKPRLKGMGSLSLLLFLTFTALYGITHASYARYHVPLEFPLIIYAAIGAAALIRTGPESG
ncbi:MAG: glycosyltransferase family 39 protein [Candidatus Omnitrophica bacterium]|nr:glycosyltransferase family 39 protein [Candidatus Omnitrophota bacterium]